MVRVRSAAWSGPLGGLAWALACLAAIATGPGLDAAGWLVGGAVALGVAVLLRTGLARRGLTRLGPADRVTLARAGLTGAVAALVTDAVLARTADRNGTVGLTAVGLAAAALALDNVDGRVARRTGTSSPLGARFDQEVDALLILVLSVAVAPTVGTWVLAIGAAHYLLLGARQLWPWLRGPAPPRFWCKVVAALQGVVLTAAASGWLPEAAVRTALAIALVLLVESFGREVGQLWLARGSATATARATGTATATAAAAR